MSKKRWKCAVVADKAGDILIGTNGNTLRIRRPGLNAIEVELKDCQNTSREQLARADIDFDPMFTSVDEMTAWMEDQTARQEADDKRKGQYSLKQGIKSAMHGLMGDDT